jgi:hypothetical protein
MRTVRGGRREIQRFQPQDLVDKVRPVAARLKAIHARAAQESALTKVGPVAAKRREMTRPAQLQQLLQWLVLEP